MRIIVNFQELAPTPEQQNRKIEELMKNLKLYATIEKNNETKTLILQPIGRKEALKIIENIG